MLPFETCLPSVCVQGWVCGLVWPGGGSHPGGAEAVPQWCAPGGKRLGLPALCRHWATDLVPSSCQPPHGSDSCAYRVLPAAVLSMLCADPSLPPCQCPWCYTRRHARSCRCPRFPRCSCPTCPTSDARCTAHWLRAAAAARLRCSAAAPALAAQQPLQAPRLLRLQLGLTPLPSAAPFRPPCPSRVAYPLVLMRWSLTGAASVTAHSKRGPSLGCPSRRCRSGPRGGRGKVGHASSGWDGQCIFHQRG